jgi:hypothetical protein
MTDLRVDLTSGDVGSLQAFERSVFEVAKRVLSRGPVNLTVFEERIKDDREANRSSYNSVRDELKWDVEGRDLVERSAGRWLGPAAFLLGLAGAAWFVLSLFGLYIGALISLGLSTFILFTIGIVIVWVVYRRVFGNAGSRLNHLWVRRTPKGAPLHARWQVFRRYLTDFSRMEESPGLARSVGAFPGLRHRAGHGRAGAHRRQTPRPTRGRPGRQLLQPRLRRVRRRTHRFLLLQPRERLLQRLHPSVFFQLRGRR